jgi:hypothetical protein
LIIAGERQPAGVHAAVCALNAHLGNTGTTVTYFETRDTALPSVRSLGSGPRLTKRRPARSGIFPVRTTSSHGETRARWEARSASCSP